MKGLGRRVRRRARPRPEGALEEAPLSPAVRRDILRLETESFDPWPGVPSAEKKTRLLRMSYNDFLTKVWKLDPGVLPYYQTRGHGLFGVGPDAIAALDGWGLSFPGFQGLKLEPGYVRGMNRDATRSEEAEDYFFHYPRRERDRGAAAPAPARPRGGSRLDRRRRGARDDRLREAGRGGPAGARAAQQHGGQARPTRVPGRRVDVTYLRGGKLHSVQAKSCVMACWSAVVPHLCPEMPEAQRDALSFAVKVPLLYTSVFVRNWKAWKALGIRSASCPGGYYHSMRLDVPVNVGGFSCAKDPEGPIVVNLGEGRRAIPDMPHPRPASGGPAGAARHALRGDGAQDPRPDGAGAGAGRLRPRPGHPGHHGEPLAPRLLLPVQRALRPFWLEGKEPPCERARKPFGRIFVANADADAYAYTDARSTRRTAR